MRYKVTAEELKALKVKSLPKRIENNKQPLSEIVESEPKHTEKKTMPTIQCKGEITLKFNEMPTPDQIKVSGQISSFDVTDGVITYRINSRTKGVNKANKNIAGFTHPYVIAASAKKITNLSKNLILLEEVGIQVFEKVPKDATQQESDTTINESAKEES